MEAIKQIKAVGLVLALFLSVTSHGSVDFGHPIPHEKDVLLTFGNGIQSMLPNRLNILVWNLHKGEDAAFPTDFVSLVHQKDLVISQEMYLTPLMKNVFESFPHYFYASATSFYFGKVLTRTGVVTSSPILPASIDYVKTQTLEPLVKSPKMTLITRYPIATDKLLTVVNIHGINFVDGASYRKEINRIYESIKKYPSPLIFAGDFNTWSDERFAILSETCNKLKLRAASFSPDYRKKFNKRILDHFYYSADIKVITAKAEDFYLGSDHKPLEVLVEYSPPILQKKKSR